jgi:predicted PurR-regulated permease PerM
MTDEDRSHRGWWNSALLAIGALLGASVVWGWLQPEPEEREELLTVPVGETRAPPGAAVPEPAPEPVDIADDTPPAWVRPTIVWAIGVVVAVAFGLYVLGLLHQVVAYLILALFFSFALEPAVNYMHDKWHWRRGAATGLLLLIVFALLIVLVLVFVPTLYKGAAAIAEQLPRVAGELQTWAKDTLGVDVSTTSVATGGQEASASLAEAAHAPVSALLGFATSLIGGIFGLFTVATFIFYMVAEASQFRRAVLSFFSSQRQGELLSIWEAAIEKTGGYFYSRLLLAAINGSLFYIVLRIEHVPGAAPLALFEGAVAAFIPIVGTYISATVPIITAFITVGSKSALVLLIYILIYQQVENYLLSPRIQGKTMQLHPAVAFGAALAGGVIGGLLWAFLALPFAATIQASASLWFQRHDVVESKLTTVEPSPPPRAPAEADAGQDGDDGGRLLRSTKGWLRRVL